MKKKIKFHNRLLFQIVFIVFVIFAIMIVTVQSLVSRSTERSFFEAQNDRMSDQLLLMTNKLHSAAFWSETETDWYLEHWESDPKKAVQPLNDEERDRFMTFYSDLDDEEIYNDESLDFSKMPEDIREYEYRFAYDVYIENIKEYVADKLYDYSFIVDYNSEKEEAMVILDFEKGNVGRALGTIVELPLEDHPAFEKLRSENIGAVEFERSNKFPTVKSNYTAVKKIKLGTKELILGISYDWSAFQSEINDTLKIALIAGIGTLIIASAVLVMWLNRKAIRPVSRITNSVSEYTENKDTAAVVKEMSEIKAKNELGVLSDKISDLVKEISRYTEDIVQLTAEKERVNAELELAAEIQSSNLPQDVPVSSEFELAASMNPAKEVGGDFYDFFNIDEDHLAMVIADVSGKGVPAALFMMMSKNVIKNYAVNGLDPAEILNRANQTLCINNETFMFVTVWLGIYEISTGHIIAANGGHEFPIIGGSDGVFGLMEDTHCKMLGTDPNAVFSNYTIDLEKGGTLFLYTDGAPEAIRSDEEMFTEDRMIETLNKASGGTPQQLIESMTKSIEEFVGNEPQFDDQTMLCIRRK